MRNSHAMTLLLLAITVACTGCSSVPDNTPVETLTLCNAERVFTPQRRGDWCWAACAEMVFKYNGIDSITQEQLVARLKDNPDDQRAQLFEIIRALATDPSPPREPNHNAALPKDITVDSDPLMEGLIEIVKFHTSTDSAIRDFRAGRPLILGLKNYEDAPGHIVFVTGLDLQQKVATGTGWDLLEKPVVSVSSAVNKLVGDSSYHIVSVEFFDPKQEGGGVKRLTSDELKHHFNFFMSREKAVEVMNDLNNTVQVRH